MQISVVKKILASAIDHSHEKQKKKKKKYNKLVFNLFRGNADYFETILNNCGE